MSRRAAPLFPQAAAGPAEARHAALLAAAIRERLLVALTYEGDAAPRLFAPHALYWSKPGRLSVTGIQHDNPADPAGRNQPRVFDLPRVTALAATATPFAPGPPIDPANPKYRLGIVAAITS